MSWRREVWWSSYVALQEIHCMSSKMDSWMAMVHLERANVSDWNVSFHGGCVCVCCVRVDYLWVCMCVSVYVYVYAFQDQFLCVCICVHICGVRTRMCICVWVYGEHASLCLCLQLMYMYVHVCLSPTCKQCVVLCVHGCLFTFHLINVIYTAQLFSFNNIPFMFAPVCCHIEFLVLPFKNYNNNKRKLTIRYFS